MCIRDSYNTVATAALAPLRDGPLPRVTGPVYAKMADAGRDLVKTMGVSGVNVMKDGKEVRAHNPHTTLVYSMAPVSYTHLSGHRWKNTAPATSPSHRWWAC